MPFSQASQLSSIVGFLENRRPESILDVGTGMGQYGFLARTNLEHTNLFVVDGARAAQRPKTEWRIRIDVIEAFSTYLTPVHDYVYNEIHVGDALDVLPGLPAQEYELVLAIDILEHFDREEGWRFLDELKRVSKGAALVSTPKKFLHQEVQANPYENHRSVWKKKDLASVGFTKVLKNKQSWICIYN